MTSQQIQQQQIPVGALIQDRILLIQKSTFEILGIFEQILRELEQKNTQLAKQPNIIDSKFKEYGPKPIIPIINNPA